MFTNFMFSAFLASFIVAASPSNPKGEKTDADTACSAEATYVTGHGVTFSCSSCAKKGRITTCSECAPVDHGERKPGKAIGHWKATVGRPEAHLYTRMEGSEQLYFVCYFYPSCDKKDRAADDEFCVDYSTCHQHFEGAAAKSNERKQAFGEGLPFFSASQCKANGQVLARIDCPENPVNQCGIVCIEAEKGKFRLDLASKR